MLKIFSSSLTIFLLLMKVIEFFIAYMFDDIARNFNQNTFILAMFSDLLDGVILGSFFLVYYCSEVHQMILIRC
jgi:hypothetical protein